MTSGGITVSNSPEFTTLSSGGTTVQAFLLSEPVKAALNQSGSALAAISVLKKVCDHPALLSERAARLVASGGE